MNKKHKRPSINNKRNKATVKLDKEKLTKDGDGKSKGIQLYTYKQIL